MSDSPIQDDDFWREKLTPEEFEICRKKGTERAFSGAYWDTKAQGTYRCRCCGEALFDSATKYDSGSGWPSFYQARDENAVKRVRDISHGMERTEVVCAKCDCHLGHLFPDGPQPTGLRFCINSASVKLQEKPEE